MRAFGIFVGLDDTTYAALAKEAEAADYPIGEIILKEGDLATHVHLLLSGEVEVMIPGEGFVRLGGGNIFGETALIRDGKFSPDAAQARRNATCVARTNVSTARIHVEALARLLNRFPDIEARFAKLAEARRRDH